MPRITLRDHKIHYQQTGEGPNIVLIHGLACHIAFWWFKVAPDLAKTHRVTAVDLRGHGFSSVTETGYRACDLAEDVAALLDHLDISDAHIVGHSFGGAVATAIAVLRPDLVSELTLADGWVPSLQNVPPLPTAREWSNTIARARRHGIAVEPDLPLVVRGLYADLIDESHYKASDHSDDEDTGWEERRAMPFAQLGQFVMARGGAGLGRGMFQAERGWRRQARRFSGWFDGAGSSWADGEPQMEEKVTAPVEKETLEGAFSITGTPGRPSHAVRRWQELMRRTNARLEYLDSTAIEPDALKTLEAPVRLIYGARSQYRPTAEAMQKAARDVTLKIIPQAGHYFPLLRPEALLDALTSDLQDAAKEKAGTSVAAGANLSNPPPRLRVVTAGSRRRLDSSVLAEPLRKLASLGETKS